MLAPVSVTAEKTHKPEKEHCTYYRSDKAANDSSGTDSEQTEKPSAQNTTYDTDHEVDNQAKASPAH